MSKPKTKTKCKCEIVSGPDQHDRYHYVLYWWARHQGDVVAGIKPGEWRERAQHFFGKIPFDAEMVGKRISSGN